MSHHRPIRLLIVDDSRFVRTAVRAIVASDPEITVVGEARDGADAIALARVLRPDIITMDLEMPEVSGLEAIRAIMAERPVPIIALSSHTRSGVWTTFEALGHGAVDFLEKPHTLQSMDIRSIESDLRAKIHQWARQPRPLSWGAGGRPGGRLAALAAQHYPETPPVSAPTGPSVAGYGGACDLVVVGVSTGGPTTVPRLLQGMGGALACPMVLAQHMPPLFTAGFAEHLSTATGLEVVEGQDNLPLIPGRVVVIAGGFDGEVVRAGGGGLSLCQRRAGEDGVHPSADLLFASAARAARQPAAVVLTGIGSDGTEGARDFAARGLPVLVQEPATTVVWGMPSSVIEAGLATQVLAVEAIGRELARLSGSLTEGR